jgi:endonuclease G
MINRSYFLTIILIFTLIGCKTKDQNIESYSNKNIPEELLYFPNDSLADQIIKHTAFSLAYSEKHEQASWVQYKLYKSNLESLQVLRNNKFRLDSKVSTGSANLNDYKKSGYDRGHIAPCADFTYSNTTMLESFLMSNMSPQIPSFNRGKWKVLESRVREYALRYDSLLIITGPVLYSINNHATIGENNVTIPEFYFKIIFDLKEFTSVSLK